MFLKTYIESDFEYLFFEKWSYTLVPESSIRKYESET